MPAEHAAAFRKAAHTYVRVIADEAAEFQAQSDNLWDVKKGDFGFLRLPFEHMWIEYKMPSLFLCEGRWERAKPQDQRYAVLIEQQDDDSWNLLCLNTNASLPGVYLFPLAVDMSGIDDPERVNETPRLMSRLPDQTVNEFGGEQEAVTALLGCLVPAYLTLGWLNCRGISTEPAPSAQINKRRLRKGQPLGLDYRRLVLDWRIRQALERNRDCQRRGKRLHIVRGHIRHYTAERPAFGNYVGNMWIHPHMRGDAALGRINHEYHVQARGTR